MIKSDKKSQTTEKMSQSCEKVTSDKLVKKCHKKGETWSKNFSAVSSLIFTWGCSKHKNVSLGDKKSPHSEKNS